MGLEFLGSMILSCTTQLELGLRQHLKSVQKFVQILRGLGTGYPDMRKKG
jgi:hypothetical protein